MKGSSILPPASPADLPARDVRKLVMGQILPRGVAPFQYPLPAPPVFGLAFTPGSAAVRGFRSVAGRASWAVRRTRRVR